MEEYIERKKEEKKQLSVPKVVIEKKTTQDFSLAQKKKKKVPVVVEKAKTKVKIKPRKK